MADRTTYEELYGEQREPDDAARAEMLMRLLQEHTARLEPEAAKWQRRAVIMNEGPLSYFRGAHKAGRIVGDSNEAKYGSRAGTDPVSAGSQAMDTAKNAQVLLDAYRQAQARKLMESLFLGPLARRQ